MQDFLFLLFFKMTGKPKKDCSWPEHTTHKLSACVSLVITSATPVVFSYNFAAISLTPPPHTHQLTHPSPLFDFVKGGTVVGGMPWGGKGCHTITSSP